ncbi:MerR family transcriptional regulator [Priestia megaterium]|uniref:MerR family transcriptional regulator n=1 Tax=Priestia megaterium TaxID=1404 RepID=UPI00203D0E8C|nr:MerR family transcriptional regulator [Priestia megaterium]MCM3020216.1 MerR family transcriptional regulator [Priestia megaterium]
MSYTISQVSDQTGLSIHTLCYYEKEGITPIIKRNESGRRIYETKDIEWLKYICCFRATGMTIADLKEFVALVMQGDETIEQRISMLKKQNEYIQSKINQLMSYQAMIEHKIKWYTHEIGHSKVCPREESIENRLNSE